MIPEGVYEMLAQIAAAVFRSPRFSF